jgi:D-alanine-D-alanine ligase
MNIVVTFNYHNKEKYGLVSEEFDTPETVDVIKNAISKAGHQVFLVEADEEFYPKLKELKVKEQIDLVFNYSVGIYGRSRETHIPAMCEMLQLPYASSDVLSTALCQDKARAKDVLLHYGIKTSVYQLFRTGDEEIDKNLPYPLIVKYVYQGSSIGLTDNKAVVYNENELRARVKLLLKEINQPIMAEEYIKGREFTVGFYGNLPEVTFFPLVEIKPLADQNPDNWVFNSHNQPVENKVVVEKEVEDRIYEMCRKIIDVFELRDWGRIDLRVRDGQPYIVEINNCAHLSSISVYLNGAYAMGLSHEQTIINMFNAALKRYNLL